MYHSPFYVFTSIRFLKLSHAGVFGAPKSTEAITLPNFSGEDLAFTTKHKGKRLHALELFYLLPAFVSSHAPLV